MSISVDAMACSSLSPQVKAQSPGKADLSIYIPFFVSTSTFFSSSALAACLSPCATPFLLLLLLPTWTTRPTCTLTRLRPTYPYAPQYHTAHASESPHP